MPVTLHHADILSRAHHFAKEFADARYELDEAKNFIRACATCLASRTSAWSVLSSASKSGVAGAGRHGSMTGLDPDVRFEKHKARIRADEYKTRYRLRLTISRKQ